MKRVFGSKMGEKRRPVVHVVTSTNEFDLGELGPEDTLVDLTFRVQYSGARNTHHYLGTKAYSEGRFQELATRVLDGIENLQNQEVDGKSLFEWFQWDLDYNLLWASYVSTTPPTSLIMRGVMALAGFPVEEVQQLLGERRLIIHGHPHEVKLWRQELSRLLRVEEESFSISSKSRALNDDIGSMARIVRDLAAMRWFRPQSMGENYDVLLTAYPMSYVEDGRLLKDRYHPGLVEFLRDNGVSVGVIPCPQGAWASYVFSKRSWKNQIGEPDWALFDVPLQDIPQIIKKFAKMTVVLRRVLNEFLRVSNLVNGVDLVPWYVAQLREVSGHVGFEHVFLYETLKQSFKRAHPKVILVKDEFYQTGMTVMAATKTPKIGIQHGVISRDHFVYIKPEALLATRPCCDVFLTYGEGASDIVSSRGMKRERLVGGGSIRHHATNVPNDGEENTNVLVCLETAEAAPALLNCVLEALLICRNEGRSIDFSIRSHPRINADSLINSILEGYDYKISRGGIETALSRAKWVVTESSTSGLDALARGKQLLVYARAGLYERFPYVSEGVARPFVDGEELVCLLNDPIETDSSEFLKRHLLGADSKGKNALLELIRSYL